MRAPMRSSIACLRCRRSKIKCDNDGGNSPCESCIKAGHLCQYPEHASAHTKRNEPGGGSRLERDAGLEKKRLKRGSDEPVEGSYHQATASATEVLSYPFLTGELWDQLFTLYRLHFASELFFLHIPTLKERMSEKERTVDLELDLVLLGVLTLTCRFHLNLVTVMSNSPPLRGNASRARTRVGDPKCVSDFFANQLVSALGPLQVTVSTASIERVQAFLMLGYYEWTVSSSENNLASWMYVGTAIRLAHGLRLGSEEDRPPQVADDQGEANQTSAAERITSTSDLAVTREIRRRTMFSCFIVDRILACASARDAMIDPDKLNIQLPCTDMALDLARNVYTGTLRQKSQAVPRHITDESVLSHFIQLVDIWGEIAKYSVGGGCLVGNEPLWSPGSVFRGLSDKLDHFCRSLPETFHLSRQNYFRHDNHQATSSYVTLHMLMSLCRIALHRESIPFLPIRGGISGGHSVLAHLSHTPLMQEPPPPVLWTESAEKVFIGARDVLDLVELCRDKLPVSPLICFAVFSAACLSVYSYHFPHLDERHLVSDARGVRMGRAFESNAFTSLAIRTLDKLVPLIPSASPAVPVLMELDSYFSSVWTVMWNYERVEKDGLRPSSGFLAGHTAEREDSGHEPLSVERERASMSSTTDFARRSLSESSHRARGSISDLGAARLPAETHTSPREHPPPPPPTHRSFPSRSFTATNEHHRPVSAMSETSNRNHDAQHSGYIRDAQGGVAPWETAFSVDQIRRLELLRIGDVLHDLQAFSGVGVLGRGTFSVRRNEQGDIQP